MKGARSASIPTLLLILASAALVVAVYWPGLSGPFLHDDHPNVVGNQVLHLKGLDPAALWHAAISGKTSGVGRPASLVSFALNSLAGPGPFSYKLVNLLLHLFNAVLVAVLVAQLLAKAPALATTPGRWRLPIAIVCALTWALMPIQVSTVLYVVQRMTILTTTFTLLALLSYTVGRWRMTQGLRYWPALASCFLLWIPLAVLSKESGVMAFAYLWCVEWFLMRTGQHRSELWWRVGLSAVGGIGLMALLVLWYLDPEQGLLRRGYSLGERVLTQGRVLWWYFGQSLVPRISDMSLVHDTWTVSKGFLSPPITALAWGGWGLVVSASCVLRKRLPLLGFGLMWFFLGHGLEAGPLSLELAYEHRTYLPSLGLVMIAALGFGQYGARLGSIGPLLASLVAIIVLALFATQTRQRSVEWSSVSRWVSTEFRNHPDSYFANVSMGSLYERMSQDSKEPQQKLRLRVQAGERYVAALKLQPGELQPLLAYINLRAQGGQVQNDALYDQVALMARNTPMTVNTFNALFGFLECAVRGACRVPQEKVHVIVNAATSNPGCHLTWRISLLTQLGQYQGTVMRQPTVAVQTLRKALKLSSENAQAWLILANWLDLSGDRQEALMALDEVAKWDRPRRYADVAAALRQRMERKSPGP